MAGEASTPAKRQADMMKALKEAAFAALVTFGLCIPIIAWGTRQNLDNQLVLDPRWDAVAWAVAIIFVGRFLMALRQQTRGEGKPAVRLLPHGTIGFFQRHSRIFSVFGLGFLLTFPIIAITLAGWGGALKWIDNFGVQILIYVMLGWGLNIVVGLAGLLDLGYVAFYAVGAYSYALLAKNFGLSFWILLPLAGILAAFWGMILGFPVLRLRGDYLAIVTLAFGEIIRLVLINWTEFSNGYAGISGIPRPSFFGIPFTAGDDGFAAVFGLEFSPLYRTIFLYYVILCMALLTAYVSLRLRRLPVGRAWEALREDEIACRSLGINTTNTKLTAFSLGAMFGGFAGSFFAARQGFISPESFVFMESAVILAIVVLGGMGSLWGCAIAAIAMIGGTELLRELDWLKQIFGPDFDPTKYRMLIFGFAMVVIMIWKPRGLISTREPTAFLKEKKVISADMVQEGHG
ncbi:MULTISPECIES: high-affinity branched-chain amino acid ABC transporter permease LivM [unclassified Bosea (in: a-proteobacteria)]|uniref:high-affinity branched-chain amino acid ABC transporter permease LivM n=1 Tax=unclassified Bosea (in: a-proteobacteria) TaxID=2653178 RepID=UPI00125ED418|nr:MULTISPECIES: high-affinity branched-chain amino acid ABC transporter permease LivM [unclassified Bosea (in: a-proteobacteria)]VXC37820.1 leucine/isoleucine/valine transporter subunit; membrane component of ABC superfamily [Bosea sp. 125]VXC65156.1 leucine/isoleucine/valine transporter subunit; membrane component of ABC superfamily [Bosea sp. 127]